MPAIQLLSGSAKPDVAPVSKPEAKQLKPTGLQSAFSNYMQQSSFNGAQMAKQQTVSTIETAKAPNTGSVQQDYAQYQPKAASQAEKLTTADSGNQTANAEVSAEVSEAVEAAAEAVKDVIKEELGVDDEQLEEAMQLLGLTQADLFNPQQLTALAVELTGSENAGMMLFSESFQNVMQQVSAITQDVLQNLGMTMDQLMDQVNQMLQTDNTNMQLTPDTPQAVEPQLIEAPAADAANSSDESAQAVVGQVVQTTDSTEPAETVQPAEIPVQTHQQVQEAQAQPEQQQQPQLREEPEDAEDRTQSRTQVQQTDQPEEAAAQQEESGLSDDTDAQARGRNMQQEPSSRFDVHADVRQNQQIDTPVANSTPNQAPLPQINVEDVIRQIATYTRIHLTENIKSIEMQLNPANLGKIFLHVTEKAGTITAQITAQDENVKEALMQQAAILKDNLNQQGIKVNAVEVSAGTHEFESNLEKDARQQEEQARQQEEQNNRRSRRTINLNDLNDLDSLSGLMSEEEALAAQIMRDNGNNLDYKA